MGNFQNFPLSDDFAFQFKGIKAENFAILQKVPNPAKKFQKSSKIQDMIEIFHNFERP